MRRKNVQRKVISTASGWDGNILIALDNKPAGGRKYSSQIEKIIQAKNCTLLKVMAISYTSFLSLLGSCTVLGY